MSGVVFDDLEQIHFRHNCLLNKNDGELFISNCKLMWVPLDKTIETFQTAWSNIAKLKYSPADDPKGRSMILVDLVVGISGKSSSTFTFSGVKEQCQRQLEVARSIISSIRTGKPVSVAPPKILAATASSKLSDEKKMQLLGSDPFLNNQYRELVLKSKIIDDDDFWLSFLQPSLSRVNGGIVEHNRSTHSNHDAHTLTSTDDLVCGKASDCFAGLTKAPNDFTVRSAAVSMSEDKKQAIFSVCPAIMRAYKGEVPEILSEQEFWVRYYASFGPSASNEIDDMFLRYADDTHAHVSHHRKHNHHHQHHHHHPSSSNSGAMSQFLCHPEVDLTVVAAEYVSEGSGLRGAAESDREPVLPVAGARGLFAGRGASGAGNMAQLLGGWSQINTQSQLILGRAAPAAAVGHGKRTQQDDIHSSNSVIHTAKASRGAGPTQGVAQAIARVDEDFAELLPDKDHCFVALTIAKPQSRAANQDIVVIAHDDDRSNDVNPFGKSSCYVDRSQTSKVSLGAESGGAMTAAELLKSVASVWPTATMAKAVFLGDCKANSAGKFRSALTAEANLYVQVCEEAKASFVRITTLLQHFYAILQRAEEEESHVSAGSGAVPKLKRLADAIAHEETKVLARRRSLDGQLEKESEALQGCMAVINDLFTLTQRAKLTWSKIQQST